MGGVFLSSKKLRIQVPKWVKHWRPVFLLLALVLAGICVWNAWLLSAKPFASTYDFDGPSGVFAGESGNVYVVDTARKNIQILNENLEYVRTIEGGSTEDDSFYYATAVTDGPDGIYVADVVYAGTGTVVRAERILRFEPDGSGGEVLYRLDYPDPNDAPRQDGNITDLYLDGDDLVFTTAEDHYAIVYRYRLSTGKVERKVFGFGSNYISFAMTDPKTGLPAAIASDTSLRFIQEDGSIAAFTMPEDNAFPYQMAVTEDGSTWFSDLNSGALERVTPERELEIVCKAIYTHYISTYQNTVYISDGVGIAVYQGDILTIPGSSVPIANAGVRNLLWCMLFLSIVMVLALVIGASRFIIRSWLSYPFFRKVAVVIIVAVAASSAIAWYMLSTRFQAENDTTMAQLEAISNEIVERTDLTLVNRIRSSAAYRSMSFNELHDQLDEVIDEGYQRGEYFYYLTYIMDQGNIYGLMDYEDTVHTWKLLDANSLDGYEAYFNIFHTGEPVVVEGEVSTWGAWTLRLDPVFDENGQVAAVQEVGFNYDNQLRAQRQTVMDTVLTIVFGAIVLVMLMIEAIYYTEHRAQKKAALRSGAVCDQTDLVPLRTLIFLAFTVDCMQDAFISILASKLYEPIFGIPQSVGAALPISGQVLMAAIFAVLGGFLASHFGAKRVICTGFLIQASGFFLCGITLQYFGILIGKLLVGAGIGMITVGVNTMAASSTDESKSVATFSGITAGTLVGVSAGSGLGSTILSMLGYRTVFFVGTAILALGFFMALTSRTTASTEQTLTAASETTEEKGSISIVQFLFGKGGSFPFLAMILLPFMSAIYCREYFFPIYAAENGMTETNIGRIYVLCGLLVIYAGPSMTRYLMDHLGGIRTVALMSAINALATLSYGFVPTMAGAIAGVLLVSLAVSSGYTAQSTYYSGQPSVSAFGEGRAMGVYSLFDNTGQTLGPILYGSAMLLGYQTGMLLVGSVLAALTAAFTVVKRKEFGKRNQTPIQEEIVC